ncbi:E3 binding domain protein, partial [mine drainage metagenome]
MPRRQEAVIEIKDEDRRSISKVLASPAIRKLAKDLSVDLSIVHGTGPNGRVLEEDVKRYAVKRPAAPEPPIEQEEATPAPVAASAQTPNKVAPASTPVPSGDIIEPRGLRRLIFEKMTKSK